jgi:hypothetical protein
MRMANVCYTSASAVMAPVAQMDRATGFEPVGRGFDSLRAHQRGRFSVRDTSASRYVKSSVTRARSSAG